MPTGTYPTRVQDFLAWSKKLVEQAAVSDRVHHKTKSSKGTKNSIRKRRKRFRRKRKSRNND